MDKKLLQNGLSLLNVGWAKDDERWNFGPICSTFMRIYWVTRGSATVTMNGQNYSLKEGHFYFIPPLTTHYDHSEGVFEHYYLHVADNIHLLGGLLERFKVPFEVQADEVCSQFFVKLMQRYPHFALPKPNPESYESTMGLLASERRFTDLPVADRFLVNGMLFMILSCFFNQAYERVRVSDNRIGHGLRFIEEHLSEPLSIVILAGNAALSKEQFIRLFHRQTGTTPAAYIISRRIFRAQTMLSHGHRSVKEVAARLGYDNLSYFCRLFRQHVGMSPRQFVRQNR